MAGVVDRDMGYRALVDTIFKFGKPKILVGVLERDGSLDHGGEMTVADIATINEYGLGVPERSFLRAWFDDNQYRAQEALRLLFISVIEGKKTKEQALELFGLWVQGEIQKKIASGIEPANAQSTIARKGSTKTLIENGILRSSISYDIDMGNGTVKQGASEAAQKRVEKEKEGKKAGNKAERKRAAEASKEKRAIRREIRKGLKKDVKRAVKDTKKALRQKVKAARKAIKKFAKKAPRKRR